MHNYTHAYTPGGPSQGATQYSINKNTPELPLILYIFLKHSPHGLCNNLTGWFYLNWMYVPFQCRRVQKGALLRTDLKSTMSVELPLVEQLGVPYKLKIFKYHGTFQCKIFPVNLSFSMAKKSSSLWIQIKVLTVRYLLPSLAVRHG